ncbi:hypothetical protein DL96DRAFT_1561046 [Flagelloscypha sp. PMI_526]|nr:hypothetical protein DL96DRAFT_1561046 [Flagelloscypha sp. PMI_526]
MDHSKNACIARMIQSEPNPPSRSPSPINLASLPAIGRRINRVSGRGKAIWSDAAEGALLKGLRVYAEKWPPTGKTKRHGKRNIWLSAYIEKLTKEMMTPKQIGSRLQQLKETCANPEVQELVGFSQVAPRFPKIADESGDVRLHVPREVRKEFRRYSPLNPKRMPVPEICSTPNSFLAEDEELELEGKDFKYPCEPVQEAYVPSLPPNLINAPPPTANPIDLYPPVRTCSFTENQVGSLTSSWPQGLLWQPIYAPGYVPSAHNVYCPVPRPLLQFDYNGGQFIMPNMMAGSYGY